MLWDFFKQKAEMREFVLPQRNIRYGIWLPADSALCVQAAKRRGVLTDKTISLLVEKDSVIFEQMLKSTVNIKNRIVFNCDLCDLVLKSTVDYAFLDYLGGITRKKAWWMANELSSNLCKDATVAITHMVAIRKNPFLSAQDNLLGTFVGSTLRRTYGVLPLAYQRILMAIHRIFYKWDFDIETQTGDIPTYRDSVTTMMVLKLVNFRPQPVPSYPNIEELT